MRSSRRLRYIRRAIGVQRWHGDKSMIYRLGQALPLMGLLCLHLSLSHPTSACCPAPRSGEPVVNADQTVILLWDPATKTEHFIRRASFKSQGDDFGFLVPSPTRPDLDESGDG